MLYDQDEQEQVEVLPASQASQSLRVDPEKRMTTPYMTKYERARVLGTRALQIAWVLLLTNCPQIPQSRRLCHNLPFMLTGCVLLWWSSWKEKLILCKLPWRNSSEDWFLSVCTVDRPDDVSYLVCFSGNWMDVFLWQSKEDSYHHSEVPTRWILWGLGDRWISHFRCVVLSIISNILSLVLTLSIVIIILISHSVSFY